jgi:hypothetical protein
MFITPALQVALTLGLNTESTPCPPAESAKPSSTLLDKSPEHLAQENNNTSSHMVLFPSKYLFLFIFCHTGFNMMVGWVRCDGVMV